MFAETYDQHLKNVARLRVFEHEQKGEGSEAQAPTEPARTAPPAQPGRGRRGANGVPRSVGEAQ